MNYYYDTNITNVNDYFPFGSLMPGRNFSSGDYRYGFNGKEMDNEVKNNPGTQYDYGFRIYDPRLGRFLSRDPLSKTYPSLTPYQFASNTPIQAIDIDGLEAISHMIKVWNDADGNPQQNVQTSYNWADESGAIQYTIHNLDAGTTEEIWIDPVNIKYEPSTTEKVLAGLNKAKGAVQEGLNAVSEIPSSLDGLMARSMGNSYGEGEDWVKAAGFELGGEAGIGPFSVSAKAKTYSTSENNIGFSFSASFKTSAQATSSGSSLTSWTPSASISGGLYVNTKSSNIEPGTKTSNSTYNTGKLSLGMFKTGGDNTGNFSIGLGTPSFSGKAGVTSEQKISFTTEAKDL